ncbi:MAG: DUF2283 domain-containing protein [Candidatus Nanohaloarchaea archaeon]
MDLNYDREADAIYIRFSDKKVSDTKKIDERTIADLDKDGEVIGIEVLEAEERFSGLREFNIELDSGEVEA